MSVHRYNGPLNPAVEAEEKEQIFELKRQGMSFRDIGKVLGMSHQTAMRRFNQEIEARVEPAREAYIEVEVDRIEGVFKVAHDVLTGSVKDEDRLKAGSLALKASAELRKLLGLDAPTRVESNGKVEISGQELEIAAVLGEDNQRALDELENGS